jgi:hypothetical protein
MNYQVLIENATGDILACGYTDLTKDSKYNASTTTIRTDGDPSLQPKRTTNTIKNWHRWNGSSYELVDNQAAYDKKQFDRQRKMLFDQTAWIWDRYQQQKEALIGTHETKEKYDEWIAWWQALRDMPSQQGFDPKNPNFPDPPEPIINI